MSEQQRELLTDDEREAVLYAVGHMIRSSGACYPGLQKRLLLESAQKKLLGLVGGQR